ncbi:unnamed protein product [Linum tenue]|uniref:GDSL esterase/lipase n=1 Tax=Linum tenue TaxID=586396 RepID=A0AAV0MDX4_9ROSI|nr:unnamed protein product [Linum tenue]
MVVAGFSSFAAGEKAVPCYFIFGDSLADNGNNNWLQTVAKVDYSPYGVDFRRAPPDASPTAATSSISSVHSPFSSAPAAPTPAWASAYTPSDSATTISSTITSAPSFIPPAAFTPSSSSPSFWPTDTRSSSRGYTLPERGKSACLHWARLDAFLSRSVGTVLTGRLLAARRL